MTREEIIANTFKNYMEQAKHIIEEYGIEEWLDSPVNKTDVEDSLEEILEQSRIELDGEMEEIYENEIKIILSLIEAKEDEARKALEALKQNMFNL